MGQARWCWYRQSRSWDGTTTEARLSSPFAPMGRVGEGFEAMDLGSQTLDERDPEMRIFRLVGMKHLEVE